MQELDSFNGQESLNPALMLTLGCWCYSHCCNFTQYFTFALDLGHKCNRWVHFWAKAASSHDMTQRRTKNIRFVMETWSQPHQKGPADVSPKGETNSSVWHFAGTGAAQRWISQSSCQELELLCLNRPDTATYACRIWLVPSPQLEISWWKQELRKWWRV